MPQLNKVIVIGRLVVDPNLRYTTKGTPVCDFRIAIPSGYGERKETAFVKVTVWSKTAENVKKYCTKGQEILAEGRLTLNQWQDKDGNRRSELFITAFTVSFFPKKQKREPEDIAPPPEDDDSGDDDFDYGPDGSDDF